MPEIERRVERSATPRPTAERPDDQARCGHGRHDACTSEIWPQRDVVWPIVETILLARPDTTGAGTVALPRPGTALARGPRAR